MRRCAGEGGNLSDRDREAIRRMEERLGAPEMVCPACNVERADYEGPGGAWLPHCPNCRSEADPVPVLLPPPAGTGAPGEETR